MSGAVLRRFTLETKLSGVALPSVGLRVAGRGSRTAIELLGSATQVTHGRARVACSHCPDNTVF